MSLKDHPHNGATFTKGAPQKSKPMDHDRKVGADTQAALDAAKTREFNTLLHNDRAAWLRKYVFKKD